MRFRGSWLALVAGTALLGCGGAPTGVPEHTEALTLDDDGSSALALPSGYAGSVCRSDGWCWENPLPFGDALSGVTACGPSDAWAAGAGGLYRWDGAKWRLSISGAGKLASGGGALWYAQPIGEGTRVSTFQAGHWTRIAEFGRFTLREITFAAPDELWLFGDLCYEVSCEPTMLRARSGTWSAQLTGMEMPLAVWAGSRRLAWASNLEGSGCATDRLYRWTGTTWAPHLQPRLGCVTGIAGSAADDVWAVGSAIAHFDGTRWSRLPPLPAGTSLSDVAALRSNAAFAVGSRSDGSVTRAAVMGWNGREWLEQPIGARPGSAATAVFARSPRELWVVGRDLLTRQRDGVWSDELRGSRAGILAISAYGPSDAWAVGVSESDPSRSVILRGHAGTWTEHESGTSQRLYGIYAFGPSAAWAVGERGELLRWNGERWSHVPSGTDRALFAITGTSPSDLWAGGYGVLLHFDGERWTRTDSPARDAFVSLYARAEDDVWAVGRFGSVQHWDGQAWKIAGPVGRSFTGVWAGSARDVWLFGPVSYRLGADGWKRVDVPIANTRLVKGWGRSAGDLYALGERWTQGRLESVVAHWDGDRWREIPRLTDADLQAIGGTRSGEVWLAGARGTVLRQWPPSH